MRKVRTAVLAGAVGLGSLGLAAGPAWADNHCDAPETYLQMTDCATEGYEKADARLNRVYKRLRKSVEHNPQYINAMVTAQRAWVTFRDADCAFQTAGDAGGRDHNITLPECKADLTRKRANQLAKYVKSCTDEPALCPFP